ncbi:MAG: sigma-70 family RNA polymerase sigma factor [Sandaracinaceae bacterium]|nr:sigma-70 family RNA polymerase sigma factor [Sandaracinaceae bacterium]
MTTPAAPLLPPTDWTDRELLARLLIRSEVAWREFHRRYDRLIYKCIHKVTNRFHRVLCQDDLDDIFGQFLLNLTARDMRRLRAFQPELGNKLGTWIGLLATNTAWDHLRRVSRRPYMSELSEADHLESDEESPIEHLARAERWTLVNKALSEFSDKDQTFVQLYYVDGLDAESVAAEMNISVKTVYSKKHKIRSRLEARLRTCAA